MSRIGKKPIIIPEGVTVQQQKDTLHIKGPKGETTLIVHSYIKLEIKDNIITVERLGDERIHRSLHGLWRTLIANAIQGVKEGFIKKLEIQGVGFKVNMKGSVLVLNLGFSHPVEFTPLEGVVISLDKENKNTIIIEGFDKQKVGETAAQIRKLKKPEPYKGKGIRYAGEYVRKKAGKSAAK